MADLQNKERFFIGMRISAIIEIFAFFAFSIFFAICFGAEWNYFNFSPHPYWIIVLLITCQYGTVEGLFIALISSLFYLGAGPLPKQSIITEWSDYFFLLAKEPLLWFVTALILGELRQKQIRERDKLRVIAYEAERREQRLADSYEALKRLKERLELRVTAEAPTTLMIVEAFRILEESNQSNMLEKASNLIEIFLSPEKFSLFFLTGDKLKCITTYGWGEKESFAKEFLSSSALFHEVIQNKNVISLMNTAPEVLGKEGIMAAPIQGTSDGPAIGMIKIEEIPFQRINVATYQTLRLIGSAMSKAYENR